MHEQMDQLFNHAFHDERCILNHGPSDGLPNCLAISKLVWIGSELHRMRQVRSDSWFNLCLFFMQGAPGCVWSISRSSQQLSQGDLAVGFTEHQDVQMKRLSCMRALFSGWLLSLIKRAYDQEHDTVTTALCTYSDSGNCPSAICCMILLLVSSCLCMAFGIEDTYATSCMF